MSILIDKGRFTSQMYQSILSRAAAGAPDGAVDGMRLMQILAGILTETLLLFDDPDEGLIATISRLENDLGCPAYDGPMAADSLPPAHIVDQETEQGRALARDLFIEWLDCAHQFHDLLLFVVQQVLVGMEETGQSRAVSLRLFAECATCCLAYEIAAQELCDIVIEDKVGREGWTLSESVSGLSAVAGRCLGHASMRSVAGTGTMLTARELADNLDQVASVMTQEAVRLGIPAGSDWRFGLAANDCLPSAPFDLIFSLWPSCREFFAVLSLEDPADQAVACAKAAGRMLAVAAGGDRPEIEPVIAKPLAIAALTDTCRTVCMDSRGEAVTV